MLQCWAPRAGQRTDRRSAAHAYLLKLSLRTFCRHPEDVKIKMCSLWHGFKGYLKAALEQMPDSYGFCSAVSPEKHVLSDR